MARNTKVLNKSNNTHTTNHSEGMHTIAPSTHRVPSTVLIPTLEHLRAHDNMQKVVADRLAELQHLNLTAMPQNIKSQRVSQVEVFVKHRTTRLQEYVWARSNKECVSYDQLTKPVTKTRQKMSKVWCTFTISLFF